MKSGQIAHLDGDSSNNTSDNLAFLCLVHHDQYDSKTNQSKNLTITEVKTYRAGLYNYVIPVIETQVGRNPAKAFPSQEAKSHPFDVHRRKELKTAALEIFSETRGPTHNIFRLAQRLAITRADAERILFELAQEGIIRIDRLRSSTQRTYSMTTAPENKLIDTFVSNLASVPISDDRFIRRGQYELDGIICLNDGTVYAVETICGHNHLSREQAANRIQRLLIAKQQIGFPSATSVILIGITKDIKYFKDDLKPLETPDLLIRYVDMG